jgi:hypothetical protein
MPPLSEVIVNRPVGVPELREAPVPRRLADAITRGPLVEASPDAILFRVPNVGRYLVHAEGPVLVERESTATDADLTCFRDEPIAAAAAFLRGELVLRAATVSVEGRAVALCGPSGHGKSALAAALAQRGHAVLADAVTVIVDEPGEDDPTVAPLAPDLVLWPAAVRELGLDHQPARRVRPALAKCAFRLGAEPVAAPLVAVILLREDVEVSEPELEPARGTDKLQLVLGSRWHRGLVEQLGHGAAQFFGATRVAASVDCVNLVRPRSGAPLNVLAALVEERLA